ncbi:MULTISPECIES: DUF6787 family protein [Altibacter]|uniref:DUF6787 family protein n=1 Tax=Altibacter TaxID=1535231 RepID=UPI0005533BA1|nr:MULTISPECIES: DUF6787 family protein [Altibacter]MCW8982254.1 diacylglyceryl transferase [Altibacter sp.]MCW9038059.1 diacylglyceryl transferase [Altibacter sp.]
MKHLKERWNINSNWQLFVIFVVFAITGSTAAKFAGPLTSWVGITREMGWALYWSVRIVIIFPLYQVLLVLFGWLFGEYTFFWEFEKKMLRSLRLGFLIRNE